jgi:hypothetical protein
LGAVGDVSSLGHARHGVWDEGRQPLAHLHDLIAGFLHLHMGVVNAPVCNFSNSIYVEINTKAFRFAIIGLKN